MERTEAQKSFITSEDTPLLLVSQHLDLQSTHIACQHANFASISETLKLTCRDECLTKGVDYSTQITREEGTGCRLRLVEVTRCGISK